MTITLCPVFGLNPSVQKCRFCEKDGDLVLFGPLSEAKYEKTFGCKPSKHDIKDGRVQAPRTFSVTFPCKDCEAFKALTAEGCVLFKEGTSDYCVVKDDAISRIFDPKAAKSVIEKRMGIVSTDAWVLLGLP